MKKLISLFITLATVFALSLGFVGCGKNSGGTPVVTASPPAATNNAPAAEAPATPAAALAEKKTPDDTFVYGLNYMASKFDPADSVGGWVTPIFMVYEHLVSYNASNNELEPMLAKSWEWADSKTLVFQLRDDVFFSNGTKFTGEDVLFSWKRCLNSMIWAAQSKNIDFDNCKVEGNTLTIKLFKPDAEFVATVSNVGFAIVSKSYVEENGEDYFILNPMGTGSYIQVGFKEGDSITYKANDNYWGGKPKYKNVVIRMMIDEATRTASFEAGELDATPLSNTDSISTLVGREAEGIHVDSVRSGFIWYINLGDLTQYFKDQNLRLAFAHAIDWKTLVQSIWGDYATLMTSCLPDFGVYYKSVGSYEYDPDLAKEYLKKGGYPDGYTVKLTVANTGNLQAIAEIIQSYLAEVGIVLDLNVVDSALSHQLIASGQMDLSITQGNGYNGYASSTIIGKIAGSKSVLGEIHTESEEGRKFQQYIVDLMSELDTDKRKAIAEEMQQFVYDQCLWIPICQMKFTLASWNYVEGVEEGITAYGTSTGLNLRGLLVAN